MFVISFISLTQIFPKDVSLYENREVSLTVLLVKMAGPFYYMYGHYFVIFRM